MYSNEVGSAQSNIASSALSRVAGASPDKFSGDVERGVRKLEEGAAAFNELCAMFSEKLTAVLSPVPPVPTGAPITGGSPPMSLLAAHLDQLNREFSSSYHKLQSILSRIDL